MTPDTKLAKLQTLLIGTTNPDKVREITALLADLPIELRSLTAYPAVRPAAETGATYMENARLKAVHYARETDLPTMAEDTGFEIDALNGEPGLRSARFIRPDASFQERFAEIYRRLRERGRESSSARFVCALVLVSADGIMFETQHTVEGRVAPESRGSHGHGYDPIFFYPPLNLTFGETSEAQKSAVSHRGQAIRALRAFLRK